MNALHPLGDDAAPIDPPPAAIIADVALWLSANALYLASLLAFFLRSMGARWMLFSIGFAAAAMGLHHVHARMNAQREATVPALSRGLIAAWPYLFTLEALAYAVEGVL